MKRLLYTGLIVLFSLSASAQVMQASIGAGSTPRRVMLYIKPSLAVNGNISTLQFDVAIPAAVSPVPTMTIVGTPNIGTGWIITPGYTEDNYRHYEILTASVFTVNIGAGVETPVMELEFSGGISSSSVSLVTLPFGGSNTGNALFLCTGAATSVEGQLYYPRTGTSVLNNLSYSGGATSWATVVGILLPVKWVSFNVIKQGNNALLNWTVANEGTTHHYEILRSSDGIHFSTIGTANRSANGNTSYQYTDVAIDNLAAPILYYRIGQVDTDGRPALSDIRSVAIPKRSNATISIFPNPVTTGFYVSIPFTHGEKGMVTLQLINATGQLIGSKQISTAQASNYYFDIMDRAVASGDHYLQIFYDGELMETKKLLINR